jgi:hypothetical protein
MDDLLTPEEMKVAIGLTADDAMIKYAHGLSDFIVVCQAQSAKTKAALVAEGWKSPQDVASIINALTDAFKWNISGEIADARADERKAIGEWLNREIVCPEDKTGHCELLEAICKWIDALLKGERS